MQYVAYIYGLTIHIITYSYILFNYIGHFLQAAGEVELKIAVNPPMNKDAPAIDPEIQAYFKTLE